jgi:redox-sensitive bicupin YhaK (pirin superfamily)
MMTAIPFNSLCAVDPADHGWLQSRFRFSFAAYHDRENMHYGILHVMDESRL